MNHKKQWGRVIYLDDYRKKRSQAESPSKVSQLFATDSDDLFAQIIQRNMEASQKLREKRLKNNSIVLKGYQIKK